MNSILRDGQPKNTERLVNGDYSKLKHDTLALPFMTIRHDMSEGFPLLTTKKLNIHKIAVELEAFIKGIRSKKWFQDRGVHIWDQWCNPNLVAHIKDRELRLEAQRKEDDLGPIYGVQARDFDGQGYDQLGTILETLISAPEDRGMLVSHWNPSEFYSMALRPCHVLWQVTKIGDTLNLGWYQRSADWRVGVPWNIAHYGLYLELLAKYSGLKPGILHGTFGDAHIYRNQISACQTQLTRSPSKLPRLEIVMPSSGDITDWTAKDLNLYDYNPQPFINFGEVTV